MAKKYVLLPLLIIILLVAVGSFSATTSANPTLLVTGNAVEDCVVDKARFAQFTVEITFKNTGTGDGSWYVNVDFEGNSWVWKGTQQALALASGDTKTLNWNGNVPKNAPIDSIARLVVYYGDSFAVLDCWIHVISDSQLSITASVVA